MKTVTQQIEKAASPKDVRTYLREPYFDGKRMLATNGHILAIVRPEAITAEDTAGHVPAEALKAARKKRSQIDLNVKASVPGAGLALDRGDLGEFINPAGLARIVKKARRNKIRIGLNADLLLKLAHAINESGSKWGDNVILNIDAENPAENAVFVRSQDGKNYGVIMPVRI